MPGTLDDLPCFERPFVERPSLMRASGSDGVDGAALLQQDSWDASRVHTRQLAFGKVSGIHHRDIRI